MPKPFKPIIYRPNYTPLPHVYGPKLRDPQTAHLTYQSRLVLDDFGVPSDYLGTGFDRNKGTYAANTCFDDGDNGLSTFPRQPPIGPPPPPPPPAYFEYDLAVMGTPGVSHYYPLFDLNGACVDPVGGLDGSVGAGVVQGVPGILPGLTCDINLRTALPETAYKFNGGSTAQVDIPGYIGASYPITLEAWVYINAFGTAAAIIGQTSGSQGVCMAVGTIDSLPQRFGVYGLSNSTHIVAGTILDPVILSTDTVYYLAVTTDGTLNGTNLYIQGEYQQTSGSGDPPEPNSPGAQIGWRTDAASQSFDGIIQKPASYSAILSAGTISGRWILGNT